MYIRTALEFEVEKQILEYNTYIYIKTYMHTFMHIYTGIHIYMYIQTCLLTSRYKHLVIFEEA